MPCHVPRANRPLLIGTVKLGPINELCEGAGRMLSRGYITIETKKVFFLLFLAYLHMSWHIIIPFIKMSVHVSLRNHPIQRVLYISLCQKWLHSKQVMNHDSLIENSIAVRAHIQVQRYIRACILIDSQ